MNSHSFAIVAIATQLAACGLCDYREHDVTLSFEVGPAEPCPARDSIPTETWDGGDAIIAVHGGPVRSVETPAHQACCYRGSYLDDGGAVEAELCVFVDIDGDGSNGNLSACPSLGEVGQSPPHEWFLPEQGTWGPFGNEVTELSSGPVVGDVYPRRDRCDYVATERTSSDACG